MRFTRAQQGAAQPHRPFPTRLDSLEVILWHKLHCRNAYSIADTANYTLSVILCMYLHRRIPDLFWLVYRTEFSLHMCFINRVTSRRSRHEYRPLRYTFSLLSYSSSLGSELFDPCFKVWI